MLKKRFQAWANTWNTKYNTCIHFWQFDTWGTADHVYEVYLLVMIMQLFFTSEKERFNKVYPINKSYNECTFFLEYMIALQNKFSTLCYSILQKIIYECSIIIGILQCLLLVFISNTV